MKKIIGAVISFIVFMDLNPVMGMDPERGRGCKEQMELVPLNSTSPTINYETGDGFDEQQVLSPENIKREWNPCFRKCGREGLICALFCVFYIVLPIGLYYISTARAQHTWTPWMPVNSTLGASY